MTREDPKWPRASQWLSAKAKGSHSGFLSVLGVPLNCLLTPGNCDKAPAAIRAALASYSLFDVDNGADAGAIGVRDFGDITLSGGSAEGNFFRCVDAMKRAHIGDSTILLGGDGAVTRPGLHSLGFPLERCGLLTFDAHYDLRDLENGLTSNNSVRALLRDGLPGANVIQVGLQPFVNSAAYARVARDEGLTVQTVDEVYLHGIGSVVSQALAELTRRADAIYVSFDLDVLDRVFAPACSEARPGGLQPWMLRQAARLCGQHSRVLIMDIVEVDPTNDVADSTSLAAASILLAFASGMASSVAM